MATVSDPRPGTLLLRARVQAFGTERPSAADAMALVRRVVGMTAIGSRRSADDLRVDDVRVDDVRADDDQLELAAIEDGDGCDVDVRISGAAARAVAERLGELAALLEFAAKNVRRSGIAPTLEAISAWSESRSESTAAAATTAGTAVGETAPATAAPVEASLVAAVPTDAQRAESVLPGWAASALERARTSTAALIADAGVARLRFTVAGWQRPTSPTA